MIKSQFALESCFLLLISLGSAPIFGQPAHAGGDPLPDAPAVHESNSGGFRKSKWFGVVDPGEKVPPLYTRDKMTFWLHEEFRPATLVPMFISGGWEQLVNTDPKYGSDSAAFGQKLGAAALRQASFRFFSDSLLPTITHEDPRYFRKAHGGITERGVYAAERVFVAQRDDGSHGFNVSDVVGRAIAGALTMTYYPGRSANWRVSAKTWGVSLAGLAGINLFQEFWPDVRDKVFDRHSPDTQ